MKVLYFGNKLSLHGCTPTTVETLGRLLQSDTLHVCTSSDKKNKLLRMIDMVRFFFSERKGADVVLIDTYSSMNFWYAVVIACLSRLYKVKYVPILHGGNLPYRLEHSRFFSYPLFAQSAVNVAPSNYLYSEFLKYGYSNTVIIPNFIEEQNYKPQLRAGLKEPKLLWVRNFSETYNPQMAIRVLAALRKEYVGASLLMIGGCNGGDECLLRTKALAESLGVSGFVEYTGKLTKEEWISRSEGCNVFINTTNFDNTPVSVIEAMALGFPIISTNVGGIPYIITDGDNGLLVNPNDVQGMVDCVRRLMDNDELCRQLSAHSVHTSQAYYSADVRKAWHLLLEDICK